MRAVCTFRDAEGSIDVSTDAGDIRFRVANLNHANMQTLESEWDRIDKALRRAVRLVASFGSRIEPWLLTASSSRQGGRGDDG